MAAETTDGRARDGAEAGGVIRGVGIGATGLQQL